MVLQPRFLAQLSILVCLSALGLRGETLRTRVITATIPDAWAKIERGGAVTFTGPGSAVLSFEAAEEIDEYFNDWFPKRWAAVLKGHGGLEATPIDRKESRKGYRTVITYLLDYTLSNVLQRLRTITCSITTSLSPTGKAA